MHTIIDEMQQAAERLSLSPNALLLLSEAEGDRVYQAALHRFVGAQDRRWWWEVFRMPGVSLSFTPGEGWRKLPTIVPSPSGRVWFIAEDDQLPRYPVFDTSAEVASQVIGECYGFEYYLVAKDLSWLVCETHHDVVHAIGEAVEERLLKHASSQLPATDKDARF